MWLPTLVLIPEELEPWYCLWAGSAGSRGDADMSYVHLREEESTSVLVSLQP